LRYCVSLLAVFVVMELRLFFEHRMKGMDGPPFTMMFLAVIASAAFGGFGPGIVATLVGAAVCDFMFIEPRGTLLGNNWGYDVRLALFVLEGFFISWIFHALRRSSAATRQMERNLRLIAENTTDVIFAYDMAGQLMYVNSAFEALTGNSISELRENPFMNYVHPDDSQRMQELFGGLFQGKRFKDVEYRIIANDGQVKWCRATWGPLVDEFANQIGVQGREADITEQRRSELTLHFLADACAVLAAHKATAPTLAEIARVAVPQYADWCTVDLRGEDGHPRTIAAAHADASKEPWLSEIQRNYPPAPDSREGPGAVMRTGQPEIVPAVTDAWLEAGARDAQHLKLLHNLAPRSVLCVPLKSGTQIIGAITFVSSEAQRRYDADDLVFATDLARRIAESVDRPVAVAAT
jgi:PAS domain S-box-containing protein